MGKQLSAMPPQRVRHTSKIFAVPIALMRPAPVHVTQRPFRKAHGDKYAADLKLEHLGFPVINHRDGIFWILDGQHRIYALNQNGFGKDALDCEVYENLTDAEAADIFLGRDDRRPVNTFDKFHIACTAEHARETDVRRIVESQGLKISQTKEEGCIGAVSAVLWIHERCGAVVLRQTLSVLKNGFAGDSAAFDSQLLKGTALLFNRYNGKTNERELAARLAATQHGVRGLLRRAESQRERTGNQKAQCVASTLVEVYNKGAGFKDRLPSWWKEQDE